MSAITIRAAGAGDVSLYLRLFGELGLDESPPPPSRAVQMMPHMQVGLADGAPAGLVVAEVEGAIGYIRQLIVDPSARRRGLGRALCTAAFDRLRAAGASSVRLSVKDDNHDAIALYRAIGLRPDKRATALWCTHAARRALPASPLPLALVTPSPDDDLALEAAFDLPIGQLAFYRARGSLRLVRQAGDRTSALGLMRFVPAFPGAFPFIARSLPAARLLLDEVERTVPDAPRFGLVIERDPPLVDALLQAGATRRFDMVQMTGPL